MSNDETSDDISSLAGRVASAKRRSAAERRQINDSKYWNFVRAVIFLYVALVSHNGLCFTLSWMFAIIHA